MKILFVANVTVALTGLADGVTAQDWNAHAAVSLVQRAIDRRAQTVQTGGLEDYRARAEGLVLFMTQFGEGFHDAPRLAQTDEIVLEILWRFPGLSKQRIVGRRDRTDLPTGIRYHRDHLGIAQNSFADRIRLGDGHEVRDVLHPISRAGFDRYEYAVRDSITLEFPDMVRKLIKVAVRPTDPDSAGVVGTVYLDSSTGEIVRFGFGFTRAAYLDDSVEDISISLEHALWDGRFWLPRRQIIEIRRHTSWFDFPARSIIRARWEIDDYEFNTGIELSAFSGAEIVDAPREIRAHKWDHSLDSALRRFQGPIQSLDVEAVREELTELASSSALSGLPNNRIGGGGVSDLVRFNRVEGLAVGLRLKRRFPRGVELGTWGGYGFGDRRWKGTAGVTGTIGPVGLALESGRKMVDFGDQAISGAVNSVAAQEFGRDLGHYFLRDQMRFAAHLGGPSRRARISLNRETVRSVGVNSGSAWGTFAPNPAFQDGSYRRAELSFSLRKERRGAPLKVSFDGRSEVGDGVTGWYQRGQVAGQLHHLSGLGRVEVVVSGGYGSQNLPAHRSFARGGPGTLVGERFRAWGGRSVVSGRVEWRFAMPVPVLSVGFVTSGKVLEIGPYVGAVAAWLPVSGMPWTGSDGFRPVVGLALEWFHRLVRIETGYSVRDRKVRFGVDVSRDIWGIL